MLISRHDYNGNKHDKIARATSSKRYLYRPYPAVPGGQPPTVHEPLQGPPNGGPQHLPDPLSADRPKVADTAYSSLFGALLAVRHVMLTFVPSSSSNISYLLLLRPRELSRLLFNHTYASEAKHGEVIPNLNLSPSSA